jgi:hypothetical protein
MRAECICSRLSLRLREYQKRTHEAGDGDGDMDWRNGRCDKNHVPGEFVLPQVLLP